MTALQENESIVQNLLTYCKTNNSPPTQFSDWRCSELATWANAELLLLVDVMSDDIDLYRILLEWSGMLKLLNSECAAFGIDPDTFKPVVPVRTTSRYVSEKEIELKEEINTFWKGMYRHSEIDLDALFVPIYNYCDMNAARGVYPQSYDDVDLRAESSLDRRPLKSQKRARQKLTDKRRRSVNVTSLCAQKYENFLICLLEVLRYQNKITKLMSTKDVLHYLKPSTSATISILLKTSHDIDLKSINEDEMTAFKYAFKTIIQNNNESSNVPYLRQFITQTVMSRLEAEAALLQYYNESDKSGQIQIVRFFNDKNALAESLIAATFKLQCPVGFESNNMSCVPVIWKWYQRIVHQNWYRIASTQAIARTQANTSSSIRYEKLDPTYGKILQTKYFHPSFSSSYDYRIKEFVHKNTKATWINEKPDLLNRILEVAFDENVPTLVTAPHTKVVAMDEKYVLKISTHTNITESWETDSLDATTTLLASNHIDSDLYEKCVVCMLIDRIPKTQEKKEWQSTEFTYRCVSLNTRFQGTTLNNVNARSDKYNCVIMFKDIVNELHLQGMQQLDIKHDNIECRPTGFFDFNSIVFDITSPLGIAASESGANTTYPIPGNIKYSPTCSPWWCIDVYFKSRELEQDTKNTIQAGFSYMRFCRSIDWINYACTVLHVLECKESIRWHQINQQIETSNSNVPLKHLYKLIQNTTVEQLKHCSVIAFNCAVIFNKSSEVLKLHDIETEIFNIMNADIHDENLEMIVAVFDGDNNTTLEHVDNSDLETIIVDNPPDPDHPPLVDFVNPKPTHIVDELDEPTIIVSAND